MLVPYATLGNPQTLNLYSYVENNPITGTDPDGHQQAVQPGNANSYEDRKDAANGSCQNSQAVQNEREQQQVSNAAVQQSQNTNPIVQFDEILAALNTFAHGEATFFSSQARQFDSIMTFGLVSAPSANGGAARAGAIAGTITSFVITFGGEGVAAGQAGRFVTLQGLSRIGDNLAIHHIPQVAAGFTSRAEGGALVLTHAEHALTRTFGARGIATARAEAGMSFRNVLARDIRDIRRIVGSKYNQGLHELIQYYR